MIKMPWNTQWLVTSVVFCVVCLGTPNAFATLLGPSPYLAFDNTISGADTAISPFAAIDFQASGGFFHLEDFEDHLFDVPGASANTGFVTRTVFASNLDSVDADDGTIDGSGSLGDSYFADNGPAGIAFTFDANVLGALPTHVGIVWTDGSGSIGFEAFGPNGSLGTLTGNHATGGSGGQTDEDRFYGVTDPNGITSIFISNGAGGIEVDHLQYGLYIPEPHSLMMLGCLSLWFVVRHRRCSLIGGHGTGVSAEPPGVFFSAGRRRPQNGGLRPRP